MRETSRLAEAERVWVELGRLTFSVGLTEDVLKCNPYLQITDSFININKREPHEGVWLRVCARVCVYSCKEQFEFSHLDFGNTLGK